MTERNDAVVTGPHTVVTLRVSARAEHAPSSGDASRTSAPTTEWMEQRDEQQNRWRRNHRRDRHRPGDPLPGRSHQAMIPGPLLGILAFVAVTVGAGPPSW